MKEVIIVLALVLQFIRTHLQCPLDERLDELVQDLEVFLALFGGEQETQRPKPKDLVLVRLKLREGLRKAHLGGMERIDIGSHEEVCRQVKGKPKEQIFHIHDSPILGNEFYHALRVPFEAAQVRDTVPDELRTEEVAQFGPFLAVGGEDAVAEEVIPL